MKPGDVIKLKDGSLHLVLSAHPKWTPYKKDSQQITQQIGWQLGTRALTEQELSTPMPAAIKVHDHEHV